MVKNSLPQSHTVDVTQSFSSFSLFSLPSPLVKAKTGGWRTSSPGSTRNMELSSWLTFSWAPMTGTPIRTSFM